MAAGRECGAAMPKIWRFGLRWTLEQYANVRAIKQKKKLRRGRLGLQSVW